MRFVFKIFGLVLLAAIGLGFFASVWLVGAVRGLPSPEQFLGRHIVQSTKIYDRTGNVLLYEIHGEEKRTVIPFEKIPQPAKEATVAVEDQGFYQHQAFDWRAMIRALAVNLIKGRVVQGGSTITQQLAKNAFLTPERTINRKAKELILSYQIEKRYSKDEILNLYLNTVPYGAGAYGIEAASQTYFSKSAEALSLAESAVLASLPKAPSYYSPWGSHREELEQRKNYALEQMFKMGFIDTEEKIRAQNSTVKFAEQKIGSIKAPHFSIMIKDYLVDKYGEEEIERGGLKVFTSLDWPLQEVAEKSVKEGSQRNSELYQGRNAALVAQDAKTGQILAMVGSKNYFGEPEPAGCEPGKTCRFEGNFNVATQGLRQPGSAIKPFAYITAFKKGYSPETVVFDAPTEFSVRRDACPIININFSDKNPLCFHPENFDQKFRGPVNLRNALAQSINVPSVKTLYLATLNNTLETARDFGITTLTDPNRYGLSLVLGGGEVKLIDLVGAYSIFAQEGVKHRQSMVLRVENSEGVVLEKYLDNAVQVIDPQYAQLINNVLSDIEARAPLFQNSLNLTVFPDREVALKTGTTNDYRDAWTIGYTPSLVVGVWAGNNNNAPMQKQGGSILAAVPIWNEFVKQALSNQPAEFFNKPEPAPFTDKPMLSGRYLINNAVHSILYYVDANNPTGPAPMNPENDPQFKNWEEPIRIWWNQQPG